MQRKPLTRRDFLRLCSLSLGSLALRPWGGRLFSLPDFPQADRLGRVGWYSVDLKERPDHDSRTVGVLYEDSVVPWLKETVGRRPFRNNQRYVETPGGYIWSGDLIPVHNQPNQPVNDLPQTGGETGMWVEVSVPYVDAVQENPPPRSNFFQYRVENGLPLRFYYSQILWVDQLRTDASGQVWYRVNERYGNPGDILWALAESFRPITAEELSPINPEVEDKRILVKVRWEQQMLSCFEGDREVYYCRISSGVATGSTPLSAIGSKGFAIWRKLHSLHMSGGTNAEGWDLPGIGWTQLFHGEGVAVHSTFWHNNFGEPMSHGCVNTAP
ncbi:MAG TPA: L,D-transpeptidase, partial [Anaerolineales bacterium]|nr:L,D-transpeptidase [Anaerolineales bacterium]